MHAGDIGTIDPDGYVRLVDRKKDIIINAAHKNMSPANIESWLRSSSSLIGQAACIGDGKPYNVASIALDPDAAAGKSASAPATIAEIAAGVELANSQPLTCRANKFKVLDEQWLPESDELTPTLKVRRKNVFAKYAMQIDELYCTVGMQRAHELRSSATSRFDARTVRRIPHRGRQSRHLGSRSRLCLARRRTDRSIHPRRSRPLRRWPLAEC